VFLVILVLISCIIFEVGDANVSSVFVIMKNVFVSSFCLCLCVSI